MTPKSETEIRERLARIETKCINFQESFHKIERKLDSMTDQVTINKTKLWIIGICAGIIASGGMTLMIRMLT